MLICSNCKILIWDLFGGRNYGNGSAKWLYNKGLGCCLSCRQTIDTKLYWVILHSEKDATIKIKQPKKKYQKPPVTSTWWLPLLVYTPKRTAQYEINGTDSAVYIKDKFVKMHLTFKLIKILERRLNALQESNI